MINFDDATKKNKKIKENNPRWLQIFVHPYEILLLEALNLEKQIHYLI